MPEDNVLFLNVRVAHENSYMFKVVPMKIDTCGKAIPSACLHTCFVRLSLSVRSHFEF